ncbi:MAG: hypothetical protein QM664_01845 [Flavihumibacter sp.]
MRLAFLPGGWVFLRRPGIGQATEKEAAGAGRQHRYKDSYDGATSDSTGHYRFSTEEKGMQQILFRA